MSFLPVSKQDLKEKGAAQADFIIVSGDAYVDHPSFGVAIIGRVLEGLGFVVAILAQPDWHDAENFAVLGEPKYAFMVTGGNIDSMVNHYSVAKKRRSKDFYSPGGEMGLRPDRATIVYCNKIREIYKNTPIIIGGIEASLRRLSHYDYWDNKVRRSILLDSGADLLIYGMAEHQIAEAAHGLEAGIAIKDLTYVKGTCYKTKDIKEVEGILLPEFHETAKDKAAYCESFMIQYDNTDAIAGKTLIEPYDGLYVVQNKPAESVTTSEFDSVYGLNYERNYHPMYEEKGGIPAITEVKFSIISNRGCYGNCNFCALAFHQGRVVQARSHNSIVAEVEKFKWEPDFKGYIHDVGGPTANFRLPACKKQMKSGACTDRQCLFPKPCKNLNIDHKDYLGLLRKLRQVSGVKKVFVRSGIRYDYVIHDKNPEFFEELCKYHISGQLKVAPEHISDRVLEKMGKPGQGIYERFSKKYEEINKKLGLKQYLVPYLMSSHPGSDLAAAVELAEYLRDLKFTPEQVQDFYPTPGTMSTCMYYTGVDPRTLEPVYVPRSPHEKAMQRALMQYRLPSNYQLVKEALTKAGRTDLIGFDKNCLIWPERKTAKATECKGSKAVWNGKKSKASVSGEKHGKKKTIRNVHKKVK